MCLHFYKQTTEVQALIRPYLFNTYTSVKPSPISLSISMHTIELLVCKADMGSSPFKRA